MFHNKVITYKSRTNLIETLNRAKFSRNCFIDEKLNVKIQNDIDSGAPIRCYIVDTSEIHVGNYQDLRYKIVLYCITEDGSKNSIILDGIEPYFDVLLVSEESLGQIFQILEFNGLSPNRHEIFSAKFAKYITINKQNWVRIFYKTTMNRKKALGLLSDYTTANNDTSFKNIIFRSNKILASGWNIVNKYIHNRTGCHEYLKTDNIRIFNVDYTDITEFGKIDNIPTMLYEKTIIANFDIETTSDTPIGDKPPDFNKLDTDRIFMISVNFSFRTDKEPFLVVNINSLAHFRDPKAFNIYCRDQYEIVEAFGQILGRLNPDKITEFNGGNYDWPFIISILEIDENRHLNFIRDISMINPDSYCSNFLIQPKLRNRQTYTNNERVFKKSGVTEEMIKIEADRNHDVRTYRLPGYIPIDIRPMMMQVYPKDQKSSLNYYLEMAKLKSKEDMAYTYMFAIEKVVRILIKRWKIPELDNIIKKVDDLVQQDRAERDFDPEYKPPLLLSKEDVGEFSKSPYELHKTSTEKILQMCKDVVLVASYCNYDAIACHYLTRKRNIIGDKHDVCHLSYNDPYDAFYRANGMKIRNLMISKGQNMGYLFSNTNVYGLETAIYCRYTDPDDDTKTITVMKKDLKFPGAYVNPPKKGLYRDTKEVKAERVNRLCITDPKKLNEIKTHNNDCNENTDRPCAGLDFSSLYPNMMNTINASPDMVLDPNYGQVPELYFKDKIYDIFDHEVYMLVINGKTIFFRRITYYYKGYEGIKEFLVDGYLAQRTVIIGKNPDGTYIVHNDPELDGLYPKVLKELQVLRTDAKKMMEKYGSVIELLNSLKQSPDSVTKEIVKEFLISVRIEREEKYRKEPSDFTKYQITKLSHIEQFLYVEYFNKEITYSQLLEDLNFFYGYYNSKQAAVKVYMNSIYGELGNKRSANFVPLLSGGVTTYGVKFIKAVKKFVINKGFRVLYGDTDSLYVCAPEKAFVEVDALYSENKITKLEYWTRMIDITMKQLNILQKEVFEFLKLITGNTFLSMAYEEVLMPYALLGQKKYIGIQHQNVIDLSICTENDLEKFKNSKSLFIRGLEMAKRGGSTIMRDCSYLVFMTAFNINENRSLNEIVVDQLRIINEKYLNGGFKVEDFIRSLRYKLPPMKDGSIELDKNGNEKGNKTVLKFVDRMSIVNNSIPTIKPPDVGERFKYVMVNRSEKIIDLNGRSKKRPVGDFLEYPENIGNIEYEEYLGKKLEININYYVKEIIGQLARFLAYHTDFSGITDDSIYEDKQLYVKADSKATKLAFRYLEDIWNNKYRQPDEDNSNLHKIITAKERERFDTIIENIFGEDAVLINRAKLGETIVSMDIVGYGDFLKVKNLDNLLPTILESIEMDMEKIVNVIMKDYHFYESYYNSMSKKKAEETRKNLQDYYFSEKTHFEFTDFNKFIEAVKNNPRPFKSIDDKGRVFKQGVKIELRNKLYDLYMRTKSELGVLLGKFIKDLVVPVKTLQDIHELDCLASETHRSEYGSTYIRDIDEEVWEMTMEKYGLGDPEKYKGDRENISKVSDLIIKLTSYRLHISEILADAQYHRNKRVNPGRLNNAAIKKIGDPSEVNKFMSKKNTQDLINNRIADKLRQMSSNI